jgi:beta-lactamase superfamily II metal-dependent hydrolase
MAAKGSTSKTTRKRTDYRVRVRMYRQGLGDCFLLSFPRGQGKHTHILIDCGVVLGTGEPGAVMTQVAQDVQETTGGKLDVLVITHEHWDHLSGFDEKQARAIFDKMEIGDLWLGWTEDEGDDLANSLREEREKKKAAVKAAKEAAKRRGLKRQAKRMAEILGFFGVSAAGDDDAGEEDGGGTAGAFIFLKKKRKPTILETGESRPMPGVEGVRVYVVGPPKDGEAMRKTNPFKGEGFGLSDPPIGLADAFLAGFDPNDQRAQPFAQAVRRALVKPAPDASQTKAHPVIRRYYEEDFQWRNIDDAWLATGERLALQLDSATNNTSLVLAIELEGGDVLLFVGDAQAGNWRSWEARKWEVKEKKGEPRTVTTADLLKRTIFYKVGHHGSHNATMREKGLELMKSDRLAACIPVDTDVAHNVKGWKHMPLPAIRERLEDKCVVIFQSDMSTLEKRRVPGTHWKDSTKEFEVRMTNKTVRKQCLYTDYFV